MSGFEVPQGLFEVWSAPIGITSWMKRLYQSVELSTQVAQVNARRRKMVKSCKDYLLSTNAPRPDQAVFFLRCSSLSCSVMRLLFLSCLLLVLCKSGTKTFCTLPASDEERPGIWGSSAKDRTWWQVRSISKPVSRVENIRLFKRRVHDHL